MVPSTRLREKMHVLGPTAIIHLQVMVDVAHLRNRTSSDISCTAA